MSDLPTYYTPEPPGAVIGQESVLVRHVPADDGTIVRIPVPFWLTYTHYRDDEGRVRILLTRPEDAPGVPGGPREAQYGE